MSTVAFSSSESSTYPDGSELELGLVLSLPGAAAASGDIKSKLAPWGQYARILTAKDFPSMASNPPSSSSSSSAASSPLSLSSSSSSPAFMARVSFSAGSVSPPANGGASQVVGWPPIRAYRMNSLVNQAKLPATEEFQSTVGKSKSENSVVEMTNSNSNKNNSNVKVKAQPKTSPFVKVNMDGDPIGRKVDLSAHSCYKTLAQTLEDMFDRPTTTIGARVSSVEENGIMIEATESSKLLDGSSEFVLTYEDKDSDWMLVGDVPWRMFLDSVKRLRIMRTSEVNRLGPRFQEKNGR
ncbi:auxin-responsive protein IAA13-like [Diospyros lotus]|uniref:auxin-responsive protein IAA13-like n=1 Tax=Diospyros lotus TaxID=55363 RepID=UPI00224F0554|nr:auxin-responsive protein IAA13-like [Diospyros lotus]